MAREVPSLVIKLLAALKMPSWFTPVVMVSYWMTSAIMEWGRMLSTAKGKETKTAKMNFHSGIMKRH